MMAALRGDEELHQAWTAHYLMRKPWGGKRKSEFVFARLVRLCYETPEAREVIASTDSRHGSLHASIEQDDLTILSTANRRVERIPETTAHCTQPADLLSSIWERGRYGQP